MCARDPKLEFFQCIYFVVVTMTTGGFLRVYDDVLSLWCVVGYGDISPSSNLSMAFTIILMLYLIMGLFPMFTELVELLAHMNK